MNSISRFAAALLILALMNNSGFGWGNGTHTHISKQLGAHCGIPNLNEMYGSVLVDGFNLVLTDKGQFIYDQLHHDPMVMVAVARSCEQRAAAFGFATHNDNWGADWTAHHEARTLQGGGYAVLKGQELAPTLMPTLFQILRSANPPVRESLAESLAYGLAPELGHDLSETAVDLMIKRREDPLIGGRMLLAARCRPNSISTLLCNAYASILASTFGIPMEEARAFLATVESDYRNQVIQYGKAFLLPESGTIEALAQLNAMIAEGYLEYFAAANEFPTDVTVTPAQVEAFIRAAMDAVQSDYCNELNATILYIRTEMQRRGIRTCRPFAKEGEVVANATEFSLDENFPNPFNPSTTIRFSVPSSAIVSLDIYNVIGQKVRTLVHAATYEQGEWSMEWDGKNDAGQTITSGTYISRLTTPSGVFSRKLIMLK